MRQRRRGYSWRAVAIGFLAGMLIALLAVSFLRPRAIQRPIDPGDTVAERSLDRIISEVSLERVPLNEAVMHISKLADIPILLDLPEFKKSDLSPYLPVTLKLKNATLATVLDDLTDQQFDPTHLLTWSAQRQSLRISTTSATPQPITRSYDVGDLLRRATPTEAAAARPVPALPPGTPSVAGPAALSSPRSIAEQCLERVIMQTLASNSWAPTTGAIGRIEFFGDEMVVVQSSRNHRLIRQLLASLRGGAADELPAPPDMVALRWRADVKQWAHADSAMADALLRKRKPLIRIEQQTSENALAAIGKTWGVATSVEPWLASLLLRPDPRVSLELHDVTGIEALRELLRAIVKSNETSPAKKMLPPLRWGIDRGVVVIVSRGSLTESMLKTRTYDLRGWFSRDATDPVEQNQEKLAKEVESFLQKAVDPPSWGLFGNAGGSCQMINDYLVVTQTYENQEKVYSALLQLRESLRDGRKAATLPATKPSE